MSGNPLIGSGQCGKPLTRYRSEKVSSDSLVIGAHSNWVHYLVDDSFDSLNLLLDLPLADFEVLYGMSVLVTLNRTSINESLAADLVLQSPSGFTFSDLPIGVTLEFIFARDNVWVVAPWGVANSNSSSPSFIPFIKALPLAGLSDRQQFSVSGYYAGSNVGGGTLIYDASIPWSSHNGGTIYAIGALSVWDGTFATLPSFLSWTGSGTGCFVRQGLVPYLRLQLYPEMFGAPDLNASFVDETFLHQKMWDLSMAIAGGGAEIQLFRLYPVNGLRTDGSGRRGVRLFAASGVDYKRGLSVKGYCPVQNNQECILKFGGDEISGDSDSTYMEGVTIYGRDMNFTKGMLWASRPSQGSFRFCAFRRARAPAIYAQKLEDWDFYNCNFGMLGANDGRGAIVFAEPPMLNGQLADVGNNAIRFNQGRFEFIDGPAISTEGENAWASTITFSGTKFEAGVSINSEGDPLGRALYGTFSKDYYIFNLMTGWPLRITLRCVAGCSFSGVSEDRCKGIFRVYKADEISCTDALISGNGARSVNMFDIQGPNGEPGEILNFKFKDNTARVFGVKDGGSLDYIFTNRNRYAIDFEYPLNGTVDTNKAYKTAGKSFWFMSENAVRSAEFGLVPNPSNETDPCMSPARTVLTNMTNSGNLLFRLNRLGLDNQIKGWTPTNDRINIGIRAKKIGESQFQDGFRIFLRDDIGGLAMISVNSSVMDWHRVTMTIPKDRRSGLRFVSESDLSSAKVYIDAVEILPVIDTFIDSEGSVAVPVITPGTIQVIEIHTPINTNDLYLIRFDNANNFYDARITHQVPFNGRIRVHIENLNLNTNFEATDLNWKLRRYL